MEISDLKTAIIDSVSKAGANEDWKTVQINISFAPITTGGSKMNFYFKNSKDEILKIFAKFDQIFTTELLIFFYEYHSKLKFNKIIFKGENGKLENSTLEFEFDQTIVEEFLSYLPKSKRGKTVPWYENEEQIKGIRNLLELIKPKNAN